MIRKKILIAIPVIGLLLGVVVLSVLKKSQYNSIDCRSIEKSFSVLVNTAQKNPKTALTYRDQFSACGNSAIEFCRNLLIAKTASVPEIIEAILVLPSIKRQADIEILISYLSHPNEEVRIAVAGQLKNYDITKIGDAIASALKVDKSRIVKVLLVNLLASTVNAKYLDIVEQLEKTSSPSDLNDITPFGSLRQTIANAKLRLTKALPFKPTHTPPPVSSKDNILIKQAKRLLLSQNPVIFCRGIKLLAEMDTSESFLLVSSYLGTILEGGESAEACIQQNLDKHRVAQLIIDKYE